MSDPYVRRAGYFAYCSASIGRMILFRDRIYLWVWWTRKIFLIDVFGRGFSVLDARDEWAPFPVGKADRPGFWVGPFFVQGSRLRRTEPALREAA